MFRIILNLMFYCYLNSLTKGRYISKCYVLYKKKPTNSLSRTFEMVWNVKLNRNWTAQLDTQEVACAQAFQQGQLWTTKSQHRGCLKATFDMPAWVGENHRVPCSMKTDKGLTTSEGRTSLPRNEPLTQWWWSVLGAHSCRKNWTDSAGYICNIFIYMSTWQQRL